MLTTENPPPDIRREWAIAFATILDMSKIEAGKLSIAREPFDLTATLDASMALVAPLGEAKGLAIDCTVARDLPARIVRDGVRIRQVLLNLLGNAIKFTAVGSVRLSARRATVDATDTIELCVADSGIGIPLDRRSSGAASMPVRRSTRLPRHCTSWRVRRAISATTNWGAAQRCSNVRSKAGTPPRLPIS